MRSWRKMSDDVKMEDRDGLDELLERLDLDDDDDEDEVAAEYYNKKAKLSATDRRGRKTNTMGDAGDDGGSGPPENQDEDPERLAIRSTTNDVLIRLFPITSITRPASGRWFATWGPGEAILDAMCDAWGQTRATINKHHSLAIIVPFLQFADWKFPKAAMLAVREAKTSSAAQDAATRPLLALYWINLSKDTFCSHIPPHRDGSLYTRVLTQTLVRGYRQWAETTDAIELLKKKQRRVRVGAIAKLAEKEFLEGTKWSTQAQTFSSKARRCPYFQQG